MLPGFVQQPQGADERVWPGRVQLGGQTDGLGGGQEDDAILLLQVGRLHQHVPNALVREEHAGGDNLLRDGQQDHRVGPRHTRQGLRGLPGLRLSDQHQQAQGCPGRHRQTGVSQVSSLAKYCHICLKN